MPPATHEQPFLLAERRWGQRAIRMLWLLNVGLFACLCSWAFKTSLLG